MKYKVGDKLKSPATGKVYEVIGAHLNIYWTVNHEGFTNEYYENEFDGWNLVKSFFEVGKTYVGLNNHHEYRVVAVREHGGKNFGWAECKDYVVTLDQEDYDSNFYPPKPE